MGSPNASLRRTAWLGLAPAVRLPCLWFGPRAVSQPAGLRICAPTALCTHSPPGSFGGAPLGLRTGPSFYGLFLGRGPLRNTDCQLLNWRGKRGTSRAASRGERTAQHLEEPLTHGRGGHGVGPGGLPVEEKSLLTCPVRPLVGAELGGLPALKSPTSPPVTCPGPPPPPTVVLDQSLSSLVGRWWRHH